MQDILSVIVFDPDDPLTLKKVSEAIKEYHSEIIHCSSPQAILDSIQKKTVHVIVLHLEKPFEKVFRLLSEIKVIVPQVEVIFVSPFDDETRWLWMEAIQRGAYEFLPKPLDLRELKRTLVQASEKHHLLRLTKLPPAESVKDLTSRVHKRKASATKN